MQWLPPAEAAPGKVRSSCLEGAAGSRQALHCYIQLRTSSSSCRQEGASRCAATVAAEHECNACHWEAAGTRARTGSMRGIWGRVVANWLAGECQGLRL